MVKCLITKLHGAVSNNLLPKIGEFPIKVSTISQPSSSTQKLTLRYDSDASIRNVDGAFVSENLDSDVSVKEDFNANVTKSIYFKNAASTMFLNNKYNLTQILIEQPVSGLSIDLSDLKFCKKLELLSLGSSSLENIDALENLTSCTLIRYYGNTDFDIANIKNLPLEEFSASSNRHVFGDISNIQNTIKSLNIENTNITGNYETLLSSGLRSFSTIFSGNGVFGDLSKLPGNTKNCTFNGNKSVCSWKTERDHSYPVIAFWGGASFGDDLDAMFINQAKCQKGITGSEEPWYTTLSVKGNRTSASDSAISTLQGMGYTIRINE